jgi:hypothetical protein
MLRIRARRRLLLVAVLATLFIPAGVVTTASPAFAASCSGYGCDNVDPTTTPCNDSRVYTVASDPLRYDPNGSIIGWLDLRYSPTCGTNWARVRSNVGVQHIYYNLHRQNESGIYGDGIYSTGWSNMLYAPTPTVACAGGAIYVASVNKFATDYVRSYICY